MLATNKISLHFFFSQQVHIPPLKDASVAYTSLVFLKVKPPGFVPDFWGSYIIPGHDSFKLREMQKIDLTFSWGYKL